ncbi:220_t:CDS:1, partial [Acaulospora morrowiae]
YQLNIHQEITLFQSYRSISYDLYGVSRSRMFIDRPIRSMLTKTFDYQNFAKQSRITMLSSLFKRSFSHSNEFLIRGDSYAIGFFIRSLSTSPKSSAKQALKKRSTQRTSLLTKKPAKRANSLRGSSLAKNHPPGNRPTAPKQVSKKTRGFIPAKFRLLPIESDVRLGTVGRKGHKESADLQNSIGVKSGRSTTQTIKDMTREEQMKLSRVKKKHASCEDFRLEDYTFESFGLLPEVYEAIKQGPLKGTHPFMPTEIQALTIPEILRSDNRHILCAAETGTGKTLAYLVPIINKLKEEEETKVDVGSENMDKGIPSVADVLQKELEEEKQLRAMTKSTIRNFNRPRAVVLLPSRELVVQVLSVAKHLSHLAKFRAIAVTSHMDRSFVKKTLQMPVDIVVATPKGLLDYVSSKLVNLTDTKYLVIDEADTMFGKGFGEEVEEVIMKVKDHGHRQSRSCQVIVVSATLPKAVNEMLTKEFPFMKRITSHSLHKALPNLRHDFIDMKDYNFNKSAAVLDVLKRTHNPNASTMIFCNTRVSAMALESFLKSKNLPVIGLFGDIDERTTKLEAFRNQNPDVRILVCTDLVSRGVDTTFVEHVILYDFPTTAVDFLHRVGRTARAGKGGRATYLITKKNATLANRIKRNIRDRRVLS